jgi:carbonic anhydrase
MSVIDEFVKNNEAFAEGFDKGDLPLPPAKKVAVVACMDARLNPYPILGLSIGDAHVIRNAGGVITDDVTRSLCISQRFLGTREIVLLHHTDCGLQQVDEDEFKRGLEAEVGVKPAWALETFNDPFLDTQQSIRRIQMSPFVLHKDDVRGFVYDVDTGQLHEVQP